jgi:hypothetical protein
MKRYVQRADAGFVEGVGNLTNAAWTAFKERLENGGPLYDRGARRRPTIFLVLDFPRRGDSGFRRLADFVLCLFVRFREMADTTVKNVLPPWRPSQFIGFGAVDRNALLCDGRWKKRHCQPKAMASSESGGIFVIA